MTGAERPLIIVTRKLPEWWKPALRELFDARLNLDDTPLSREELVEAVKTADVLVPTVTDRIDRSVLSQAGPQLKLIAQFGTGVDNIDLERARTAHHRHQHAGVLTEDTADMTMALILAVPRGSPRAHLLSGDSDWHGWSPTWMLGHRICGKRLGIVGMGRIGQAVARGARGLRPADPLPQPPARAAEIEEALEATYWDSLDQMLARMDIISINCPHTPATYHLLSARRLKLMQPRPISSTPRAAR
jgi:glyoxylate reductase